MRKHSSRSRLFCAWPRGIAGIAAVPGFARFSSQKDKNAKPRHGPAPRRYLRRTKENSASCSMARPSAAKNLKFRLPAKPGRRAARRRAHAPGGAEIKATGQLKLSADGAPIRYDWSAQTQKKATGAVDFANGTAKCSANLGGASPMMQGFQVRVAAHRRARQQSLLPVRRARATVRLEGRRQADVSRR